MIKYTSKRKLHDSIDSEAQIINSYLYMQTALAEQLGVFINSKVDKLDVDKAVVNLNRLKHNICLLNNLLDVLNNLKETMGFLTDDGLNAYINDYNSLYSNYITTTFSYTNKIEEFIHNLSLEMVDVASVSEEKESEKENIKESAITRNFDDTLISSDTKCAYNSLVNNTLIISEIRKEVILPYNLENVKLFYQNNSDKYSSIEQVVQENYTYPISKFKPFSIARFKEAYKLIRKRENGTKRNALSLGLEMLFNYNLHPAIIAACKNVDELDIYLSCLDDNQLGDFDIFNIRYEIPPTPVKTEKNVVNA